MPKGGEERVVLQGVIEKVRRRPSVDLSSNTRGSSVDQKPVSGAAGAAAAGWWVEDGSVDRCMICAEPFRLMSRRHHCRACGNVICQKCSPNTALIAELPTEGYQRVCTQCYWGQELVYMVDGAALETVAPLAPKAASPVGPVGPAPPTAAARTPPTEESDAVAAPRSLSSGSAASSVSGAGAGALGGPDGEQQFFPTPLFAAKLKRADGTKVFINIGTNDSLLPTETIVTRQTIADKTSDLTCYDYVISPDRAAVYTLLAPDSAVPSSEVSKETVEAKNSLVYDAVKLISLKYGNLGLVGIEPSYPETRNNHKGKICPFERSPSKIPMPSRSTGHRPRMSSGDELGSFADSPPRDGGDALDPPPLHKGWVTVLGSGGKGLVGMGNKKRFAVLDAGLFSIYKSESDTAPYGHHKKASVILDGAVILDDQHGPPSAESQRRSSSVDSSQGQKPVQAKRRSSVFGVKKEVEAKRLFINSAHGGKRIDVECDSAEDRVEWSRALQLHAEYAALRVTQPSLVTESFVDDNFSDTTSVVSETGFRRSVTGSSSGPKGVRRGSMLPTTWAAYSPYMQDGESVLEAGEVSMKIGLLGRYGSPRDLVLTTRGRLYVVDMDARDVDREIDLIVEGNAGGEQVHAKSNNEKVFELVVGKTTYHFKDVTGFKVENWVNEINTVARELSSP